MRRRQKQQVEALFSQMEEAHEQIRKYIENGNIQMVGKLLEDCQAGGIAVGNLIEEIEGKGHLVVLQLEEYCEFIYRIHEKLINKNEGTNANKVYKLLRKKIIKVINSFKDDIRVRTEVVFLPYKASMWDSMESVWKAADNDENCDAYVIPIPYYDKNPDGSFLKMHYEGDQFPEYVPVIRYDKFDFETHHPDVIYIHNPYDSSNLVTSVHPFFFSDNIKKFTDKLVYIPYFILAEIKPDEDERINSMKHFCTVPGVYNADKVIVQSEDMRQVYIKVLMETSGDCSEAARKKWENRILGLGSPKFDKVAGTEKGDVKVPERWMKIIRKSDSRWKKVVLYNTSIRGLLIHNEKMLEKMKYVFDIFRNNQEELALLWRPHPLIESTFVSMRPQLWKEYVTVRDQYLAEGWGIYDDTADVDRAIAISDVYYGDDSSVVHLFQKTGKPIMMQNVEIVR